MSARLRTARTGSMPITLGNALNGPRTCAGTGSPPAPRVSPSRTRLLPQAFGEAKTNSFASKRASARMKAALDGAAILRGDHGADGALSSPRSEDPMLSREGCSEATRRRCSCSSPASGRRRSEAILAPTHFGRSCWAARPRKMTAPDHLAAQSVRIRWHGPRAGSRNYAGCYELLERRCA